MQRIVVGIDGSEISQRALEWAVEEARLRGAKVTILHAWSMGFIAASAFAAPVIDPAALERAAADVLETAVTSIDASDVTVENALVCGGAAEALITAAKDADLLVVGSRGRGGFAELLLGSVSHQVCNHAPCPVVVIPPADE